LPRGIPARDRRSDGRRRCGRAFRSRNGGVPDHRHAGPGRHDCRLRTARASPPGSCAGGRGTGEGALAGVHGMAIEAAFFDVGETLVDETRRILQESTSYILTWAPDTAWSGVWILTGMLFTFFPSDRPHNSVGLHHVRH